MVGTFHLALMKRNGNPNVFSVSTFLNGRRALHHLHGTVRILNWFAVGVSLEGFYHQTRYSSRDSHVCECWPVGMVS